MKIGLVDIDTSHPENWIPILRASGHTVVGICDSGMVHPPGYTENFARERDIPRLFTSVQEMSDAVDCAIIHGCNWDTHVDRAQPFVEAGKSVLVDKPIAGRWKDLKELRNWLSHGAAICGGSALLYCDEVTCWLRQPVEQRGEVQTVFCGCGVDDFNYGIHAYALLACIMGPGVQSVRHLAQAGQRLVKISMRDGRQGVLCIGCTPHWLPFYATIVTDRGVTHLSIDHTRLYENMLRSVLPYLSRETAEPPLSADAWIEPELSALAARQSWLSGDIEVALNDIDLDSSYDGAEFAAMYKAARYPGK